MKHYLQSFITLVFLTMTSPLMAGITATTPSPIKVAMEDQFGQPRDISGYRGHVIVLIYGDKASADANKNLGTVLHLLFHPDAAKLSEDKVLKAPVVPTPGTSADAPGPDVITLPVACIGKVPGLVKTVIRNQFRKGSPVMPVWLDFEDLLRSSYPFQAGVPNVLIIDPKGNLRYTANGFMDKEQVNKITQIIQDLRVEALKQKQN